MSDEARNDQAPQDAGRRTLIKAVTVAGGAAAAAALLPHSWKKPVASIGGLPAHAQTSVVDGRLTVADMAGTYALVSQVTNPVGGGSPTIETPPTVTGILTLTRRATYSLAYSRPEWSDTFTGTFTVDDPSIVLTPLGGGLISDDGGTITINHDEVVQIVVFTFTRT